MLYEIWVAHCDLPSEWDGGGRCVETVDTHTEAELACSRYQVGGHAAWVIEEERLSDRRKEG